MLVDSVKPPIPFEALTIVCSRLSRLARVRCYMKIMGFEPSVSRVALALVAISACRIGQPELLVPTPPEPATARAIVECLRLEPFLC